MLMGKVSRFNLEHPLRHSTVVFLGFLGLFTLFFASVLFSDRVLAPGDGITYFLPAFYAPKPLWTDLIFGGYPIAADIQNMTWYPPAMLLSRIPNAWNMFVILAYVLAGSFAYCYVYHLTRLRLASTVAGLVYSLNAFMISHLAHAGMIHAAAWIPLLVCALEQLRHRASRGWNAVGIAALVGCLLGGHPQISVYGIGTGLLYALFVGWSAPIGRWKFYRLALAIICAGLGLCAIQIIPTFELSQISIRAEMPFEKFIGFSLPTWQALQLVFPYLFGGGYLAPYNRYYWGKWGDLVDISGYVGLLPILFAVIGSSSHPNRPVVRFWVWFGLITLMLTFGSDLFMGQLLYHVPLYNKFQAQGRHFIEVSLAVSVLAGLGVAAMQQQIASKRLMVRTIAASLVVMLISFVTMWVLYPFIQTQATQIGMGQLSFSPLINPAVAIPIVILGSSITVLCVWHRYLNRRWSGLLLLAMIVVDLSSFGQFHLWQIASPDQLLLMPIVQVQKYRDLIRSNHQRVITAGGASYPTENGLFPNLTRLWNLPNAGGYSPLIMMRVSQMMQMHFTGAIQIPKQDDRRLDLMSVRYLLTPAAKFYPLTAIEPQAMPEQQGIAWANTDLGINLGSGPCAPAPNQTTQILDMPRLDRAATEIGVITTMGCSVEIPNQVAVLQVQVTDDLGQVETHALHAGQDTAEISYDRPDIQPQMQHQRASIAQSFPAQVGAESYDVHRYIGTFRLDHPQQIKQLELKWTGLPGVISIFRVNSIDRQRNRSTPIIPTEQSNHWKRIEQFPHGGMAYENQQVLPRAWLVSETVPLQPAAVLNTIHTSRLPDNRRYDPTQMALVEDPTARLKSVARQSTDVRSSVVEHRVEIIEIKDTQVTIETQSNAPAFLVLSDVNYPGWQAMIDGQPTPIFQTNYIQRGVKIPAGKHIVRFRFDPLSFKLGVGITGATCFVCLYWLTRMKLQPKKLGPN
jgi:hypothetical protein